MRLSELCGKEVINLCDGARLGIIGECDLTFEEQSGKISSILLPNKGGLFSIFGEGKPLNVPWYTLKRIGDEVVIVELDGAAEKRLGKITGELSKGPLVAPQFNSTVFLKQRDTEQMHICAGVGGLPLHNEQSYALNVLNTILGGGLSSRLFQSIREDRGLAYAVYSYLSSYQDAGLFTVYAGTRPANAKKVVALIQSEMKTIGDQGITSAELARAKEYIIGNLLLGLENTSSRMMRLGKLELSLREVISVEELIRKVELVTFKEVHQLARSLFHKDGICITALGPVHDPFEILL